MITPSDSPSSPPNYAGVPVQQMNIQAPLSEGEISAAFDKSIAEGGAGVLYPISPRVADTRAMMESPQGYGAGGIDILGGYHSGGGDGWPNDVEPVHDGP
jgi:hypothetical protein